MLSSYFVKKTGTQKFDENLQAVISELKDKRVVLYVAGCGFVELNKKYQFKNVLNIVAIADKKFETGSDKEFAGIKAIAPKQILNEEYDAILITNEYAKSILNYLKDELQINDKIIKTIFVENIFSERENFYYLEKFNFAQNIEKIKKKLKDKTVVLYGAGIFFETIMEFYDLSGLNIIGISDRKFEKHEENAEFMGFKAYSPDEIKDVNPDYVLVSTQMYVNIIEELYYHTLKDTKIKIKPLVKKPFWTIVKEVWG